MRKNWTSSKKLEIYIIIVAVTLFLITGFFSFAAVSQHLDDNVSRRAVSELNAISDEQKQLICREIERQFTPLEFLSVYLSDGNDFTSESCTEMIKALIETNAWCTVGYADLSGNTINYEGESLGDISQRTYFMNIADGSSTKSVEYLATTNMVSEPRFMFSVPIYQDNAVIGVLFASKEVSVLEPVLLSNTNIEDNTCIFVIADDGTLLSANEYAHEHIPGSNFFTDHEEGEYIDGFSQEKLTAAMKEAMSGSYHYGHGTTEIVTYSPLGVNDWYLFTMAEKHNLEIKYAANLNAVRQLVTVIMVAFGAMNIILVVSTSLYLRRMSGMEQDYRFEENRNKILMNEMACELFVYDGKTGLISTDGALHEKYGIDFTMPADEVVSQQKALHPECDFERIRRALKCALKTGDKQDIVFMLSFEKEIRWIKLALIPYSIDGKKPTHVFGLSINVTEEHTAFEKNAELLYNMPGGFHRCYLNDPIHVEYISEGLCELLGYTREELDGIMIDGDYSLAIYEADRQRFCDFVYRLAQTPGTESCEYRMIKKDGSIIYVSDTMESILASTGVMYGYSGVYDITNKTDEIRKLAEELQESRIKNSMSQMQPHFLYNALASIREIILEDPNYAADLILDFTTHLRACIKAMSSNDLIPFSRELDNIKAYVNIEKMRFGEKLKVEYESGCEDFMIVPLSIQPLVENAIRHGVYQRGAKGGTVKISTSKGDGHFLVCVKDDGVGFDYGKINAEIESGQRDSTGLSSLIFRLERMLGAAVTVSSKEGIGTEVTVKIPIYSRFGGAEK